MCWLDAKLHKNELPYFTNDGVVGCCAHLQGELGLLHALHSPDGLWVPGMDSFLGMNLLWSGLQRESVVQLKYNTLSFA